MIPFVADRAMVARFDAAISPFMNKVGSMTTGVKQFQVFTQTAFSDVDLRANNTAKALLNIRTAAMALAAPVAMGGVIFGLTQMNDEATKLANQMQAIGIESDFARKKVYALAIETRTPVAATVDLLARMQKSLQGQDVERTIRQVGTLNRLMATGGLDTNARASVSLQFGQALQSGVLQGDELRSLREAAPYELLEAIAKAAGSSVEKLRDLGSEGKITRDVMIRALDDLEQVSREKMGKFAMTFEDASAAVATGTLAIVGSLNKGMGAYDMLVSAQAQLGQFMLEHSESAETLGRALRLVFDASLLLAGTRGLLLLGTTLAAVTTRLTMAGVAAGSLGTAMVALRGVMALMGGPLGAALFAAGAAFLYWKNSIVSVDEALDAVKSSLADFNGIKQGYGEMVDAISLDLRRLEAAEIAVSKAIKSQSTAALETATIEKQAIQGRIEKNRELLASKAAVARFELDEAKRSMAAAKAALEASITPEADTGIDFSGAAGWGGAAMFGGSSPTGIAASVTSDQYHAAIQAKIAANIALTAADVKFLNDRQAILDQEKAIAEQTQQITDMEIAARERLAKYRQTGGDASLAEEILGARYEATSKAVKELFEGVEKTLAKKDALKGMQESIATTKSLMEVYNFDKDARVKGAIDQVAEALDKAGKNVEKLDDEELTALKAQVEAVLGVFDDLFAKLGLVRKELENPYKLYDQMTAFNPAMTDRGAWSRNAQEAAQKGMLDLIGYAEGTDKGRGYNETLGYGKFTGGPQNLTSMSLREVRELQRKMLAHPDNTFNSSALGRYQIVGKTLDSLVKDLRLDWDRDQFTPEMQDRMAQQLLRRRSGQGVAGLRNEWEGLRHVDSATIGSALGQTTLSKVDPEVRRYLDEEIAARKEFSETVAITNERRQFEASLMTMTASEQLRATTRFELLNDAKRRGIDLDAKLADGSRTYRQEIEALADSAAAQAQAMEVAEERASFLATAHRDLKDGILDAAAEGRSFSDVLGSMANMFKRAAFEALLFGSGPLSGGKGGGLLSGLVGGGVKAATGGGGIGGFIKGLFGFANGGVMTSGGPLPLHAYANGGIATSPQLALFGEGAHNEAYVPLPDGRTIPVTLRAPDLGAMLGTQAEVTRGNSTPRVVYVPQPYIAEIGPDDGGRLTTHVRRVSVETMAAGMQQQQRALPAQIQDMQSRGILK